MRWIPIAGSIVCGLVIVTPASAQAPAKVDFGRDVQPILKEHCYECHGPTQQMNGFRLDRRRDALRGGTQTNIGAGNAEGTRMYQRLIGTKFGLQMPPAGPLPPEKVAIIKAWIDQGIDWPDALSGEAPLPPVDPSAARVAEMLRAGDVQGAQQLLRKDPKVANLAGPRGSTPLMFAALYADIPTLRLMLELGANPNAANAAGATPLMWAVDNAEKVRLLLGRGADPNVKSEAGVTPVMAAAARVGNTAAVAALLDGGARPDGLPQAARAGNGEAFRLLVERGADIRTPGVPSRAQLRVLCPGCADVVDSRQPSAADAGPASAPRGAGAGAAPPQPAAATAPPPSASADGTIAANAAPPTADRIRAAVQRTLPLLQQFDVAFVKRTGCVSCHNNSLTTMTVAAARRSGYTVNEQIVRDQNARIAEYLESWRENALQVFGLGGTQDSVSYLLFGLNQGGYPGDLATDAIVRFLLGVQQPDGHWKSVGPRPPMEGSVFTVTALSLRALQDYAPKPVRAEALDAARRAAAWLSTAEPQDTEDRVFQLLGLTWAGVKDAAVARAAHALLAEQRADGGWGQLTSLASDPYATGEALVALRESGAVKPGDAAFRRGVQFLLQSQRDDGSWFVQSRTRLRIQPLFELGFPHGDNQWISVAATNWAATALALATK